MNSYIVIKFSKRRVDINSDTNIIDHVININYVCLDLFDSVLIVTYQWNRGDIRTESFKDVKSFELKRGVI